MYTFLFKLHKYKENNRDNRENKILINFNNMFNSMISISIIIMKNSLVNYVFSFSFIILSYLALILFNTRKKQKNRWIKKTVTLIIIPIFHCLILVCTTSSSTTSFFKFTTFCSNFRSCCTMASTRWSS